MNIYIQQIKTISIQNKYLKWYVNIIVRAIGRSNSRTQAKELLGYCEKHHIVPECLFKERTRNGLKGFLDGDPNHPDNFAYLTAKEHIFCHLFLIKMAKDKKSKTKATTAVDRLLKSVGNKDKLSPRMYCFVKEQVSLNNTSKSPESKQKAKQTKMEKYGEDAFNNSKKAKQTRKELYGVYNISDIPGVQEKSKQTKQKRYGNENYNNRNKAKRTCKEMYGVEHPAKMEESKNKVRQTKLENYDDENYNNRNKAKQTWIELYGVDNPRKNKEIKEKAQKTIKERYGVDNISQIPEVKEKISKTWLEKENIICPHCNFGSKSISLITQWHFDNCKHNPNKIQEVHKCSYCEVTSTSLRILKVWHFDNCKNKVS